MPDQKKTSTRGNVSFEAVKIADETMADENIKLLSCWQPPAGSKSRLSPELKLAPRIDPRFLQQSEVRRLQTAAKTAAETSEPSTATILTDLAAAMKFQTFDLDLARLPAEWDEIVRCYDVTVASSADGEVWEVTAKATAAFTSGGESFPAGDTIATFRIWVPRAQRFVRHFRWNPACCQGTATSRGDEVTEWWWPDKAYEWAVPEGWKKFEFKLKPEYKWQPEEPPNEGPR